MGKANKYFNNLEISFFLLQNIEEKNIIHQLENKSQDLNLERLADKHKLNEIR